MSDRIIDVYMNSAQAARQLGLHKQTLLKFAREGKIRHRRVGKNVYFSEQDILDYLNSSIVEPNGRTGTNSISLKHIES